jgi:hypothetical protein
VVSAMKRYTPGTGVDQETSVILSFPHAPGYPKKPDGALFSKLPYWIPADGCQAITTSAWVCSWDPDESSHTSPPVRIQGSDGEIQVWGPPMQPHWLKVIGRKKGEVKIVNEWAKNLALGHGLFWEADEVAKCIRDGKIECETMPLAETLLVIRVMDQVRKQGGLVYPNEVESWSIPGSAMVFPKLIELLGALVRTPSAIAFWLRSLIAK